MDWQDTGFFLSSRPYGENAAIVHVMTENHGKRAGMVWNARSRRMYSTLNPGNHLRISWRSRLYELLGTFTIELLEARTHISYAGPLALNALSAICDLLDSLLPQFDPHRELYRRTAKVLNRINADNEWLIDYLLWEVFLLQEIGLGLDLGQCAVTNYQEDLIYVSPKSGSAVSRAGAGQWGPKLLPLPNCMLTGKKGSLVEIAQGLQTTGFFLKRGCHPYDNQPKLPASRIRLENMIKKRSLLTANHQPHQH